MTQKYLRGLIGVFVLLLGLFIGMSACSISRQSRMTMHPMFPILQQLQREQPELALERPAPETPALRAYREYYGLTFAGSQHLWGMFDSGAYRLAAHIFLPPQPKGTVFVLHGYLDHTGMLRHLIRACLEQQWVVVTYDLPGHGLSSGERASISSFDEYRRTLEDMLAATMPALPRPYALISHSTGGAIALTYLRSHPVQPFTRIIFLAPLVRYAHWHLAKLGYALGKPLRLRTVPRRYSDSLGDPAFAAFMKSDPLQTDRVPLKWVGAVFDWNSDMRNAPAIVSPALIIQGKRDDVVDWKYNLPFLRKKLPQAQMYWIDAAGHQLANETPDIRADVFKKIAAYLDTSDVHRTYADPAPAPPQSGEERTRRFFSLP